MPPRLFYSLHDAATRWGVTPFDAIGWAMEGYLTISVALTPVETGQAETLSGVVDIEAAHVFPLFRRDMPSRSAAIRCVRKPGEDEPVWIADPADGVEIVAADVLVRWAEIEAFERRFAAEATLSAAAPATRRRPGPGAPPRHDWDAFYAALARRIHEHGLPRTQADLVREMRDWFESREDEHAPDESTIARKVRIVWQEICRA